MVVLKKIKAASLPEAIVALTIIVSVFSIVAYLLVSVITNSVSVQSLKAREALKTYAANSKKLNVIRNEEIAEGEFFLRRDVSLYRLNNSLYQLLFSVSDLNNKIIYQFTELKAAGTEE